MGKAWVAIETSRFRPHKHLPKSQAVSDAARLWSLVDCPLKKEPLPSSVTDGTRQLSFVAAVSLDESRYKALDKQPMVRSWYMSPWTEVEELLMLLTSLPSTTFSLEQQERCPTLSDISVVRSLIRDVSPCVRDIHFFLVCTKRHKQLEDDALCHSMDHRAVYRLLSGTGGRSNDDSHALVLISRAEPVPPDAVDDDCVVMPFKPPAIYERMLAKVLSFRIEETMQLYSKFRLVSVGLWGSPPMDFADFLFESMAMRYVLAQLR
ncbi:hypothetical protein LXA43DRAFT_231101 [Ganoderma leucocontextum]|nr:hypothetical protein LXA43DRAFT_231101 [Ganoderma leucocontextum]